MDKLTPTARLTRDALHAGPGNVHELCERTGRSRSATDKALAELAKAEFIVKVDTGGDAADGAPTRWQLTDPSTEPDDTVAEPVATDREQDDSEPGTAATEPTEPAGAFPNDGDAVVDTAEAADRPADHGETDVTAATTADESDDDPELDGDESTPGEPADAAQQVKTCRGCQAQMPLICPGCWQKTPVYCATCRKATPTGTGQPGILPNGLPKLRAGELEALVVKVMQEHPMPHHLGITGWTGGRVAIFLPGRSPSAITNALRKLSKTGVTELIGENPERYGLKTTALSVTAQSPAVEAAEAGTTE